MNYQVVVLGGGPGGYVAAIKAAQCGLKVALVEKDSLGGTCLNRGCIPTKALLRSAEVYETMNKAKEFGIEASPVSVDAKRIFARKDGIVKQLVNGVRGLIQANKIDLYRGSGKVITPHQVEVNEKSGTTTITTEKLILATGSKPFVPAIPGFDLPGVITSDEALDLGAIPKSMVIIGGGVIGLEFAYLMQTFGCKVTIIEMMPALLPMADKEAVEVLVSSLEKLGVTFFTNAKVSKIAKAEAALAVEYQIDTITYRVEGEKVLVSTGRAASVAGIESLHLHEKKGIPVNAQMETSIPDVFAIGDVVGGIQLAHVASAQGIVAAQNAAGINSSYHDDAIPSCIYTNPEVAWVGMNEQAAKEKYGRIKVGKFPFQASGKAMAYGETNGFVKIICEEQYGEILGVHIVGPHATDLISEGVLAKSMEATLEELAHVIHPHPTLSEAIMEAAHVTMGQGIHFMAK
ncbi:MULTISPECIES: dihydrolipoyl dehydrogenase [Pelosinus]|uniref:Dihydrolipoyl dehydrogenase n=1 Tax=Pelosinus fermentans B4 TaxID=1149862 RepID=I9LI82_9FIRM|nr:MULTISPECIES: dihydrolipoyl dehydrogenase [Pelosinus]EIW20101.1 dihydrolipoamide dehydrogenase [Pelosinus fermentans B4]EIW26154.1 dihydrolipoamide dehydrogenase [Pelosinus fermentans A11]OAM93093.1 dihydrolipoamide dehydrogenase [Pelosinus fermentans DSM 17108]SDQ66845.1 dihydrolipoamide dehydrogenase [Pelosinus fermentans]